MKRLKNSQFSLREIFGGVALVSVFLAWLTWLRVSPHVIGVICGLVLAALLAAGVLVTVLSNSLDE